MKKKILTAALVFALYSSAYSQVENVPVANPVYSYLTRAESKGLLKHFSMTMLPLTRGDVEKALMSIRSQVDKLSESEIKTLEKFEKYFGIINEEKLVVFYSDKDTTQVFSTRFFDDNPKYFYHYRDTSNSVYVSPLASADLLVRNQEGKDGNVLLGNLGVRLSGTLSNCFGYYLQATNGSVFSGDKDIALLDPHISQSIKFTELRSDFDFAESSVAFQYNWFYASIGRETRRWGAGINHSIYVSGNAPPFTVLNLGVKFKTFEYRFSHGGLLATYADSVKAGFNAVVPQKYSVMHRFAVKPSWGEVGFWESIIYSKRNVDLEYLNPLSFFKSLEHALRDRDNSMMGLDLTIRPFNNIEVKGSFILDDIIFSEIGNDFWSNKYAWNFGAWYSSDFAMDFGIEYARIEPFTFSHFDSLNTYTNDNRLIGTELMPNSDEISAIVKYWWGAKYPIQFKLAYRRHGANQYDANGQLINNVGGDFNKVKMPTDSDRAVFLDGDLQKTISASLSFGFELFRDFSAKFQYTYNNTSGEKDLHFLRLTFSYDDF